MNKINRANLKYVIILLLFTFLILATMFIYYDGIRKYNNYRYKSARNVSLIVKPTFDNLSCSLNDCSGYLGVNFSSNKAYYKIMDKDGKIVSSFVKDRAYKNISLYAYYDNYYIIKEEEKHCLKKCHIFNVYKNNKLVKSFDGIKDYSKEVIYAINDGQVELYDNKFNLLGFIKDDLRFYKDNYKLFASTDRYLINSKGKLINNKVIDKEFRNSFDEIKYLIIKDLRNNNYHYLSYNNDEKEEFISYFEDDFNKKLVVKKDNKFLYLDDNGSLSNGVKLDYYNDLNNNLPENNILKKSFYQEKQKAYIVFDNNNCYLKNVNNKNMQLLLNDCKEEDVYIKKLHNNITSDFIALVSFNKNVNSFVYNFSKGEYLYIHNKNNDFIEDVIIQYEYISLSARDKKSKDLYNYYLYKNNELIEKNNLGLTGVYNINILYGTRSDYDKYFDVVKGVILNNSKSNIFEIYNNRSYIRVIDNKDEVYILKNNNNYINIKGSLKNINNIGMNINDKNFNYYNFFDMNLYKLKLGKDEVISSRDGSILYPFRNAFFINNFKNNKAKILDKNMKVIYESGGEIISIYKKSNSSIIIHFKAINNKRGVLIIN